MKRKIVRIRSGSKCVANAYAGADEQIIEFGVGESGNGGLISVRVDQFGTMHVDVYRTQGQVVVRGPSQEKTDIS